MQYQGQYFPQQQGVFAYPLTQSSLNSSILSPQISNQPSFANNQQYQAQYMSISSPILPARSPPTSQNLSFFGTHSQQPFLLQYGQQSPSQFPNSPQLVPFNQPASYFQQQQLHQLQNQPISMGHPTLQNQIQHQTIPVSGFNSPLLSPQTSVPPIAYPNFVKNEDLCQYQDQVHSVFTNQNTTQQIIPTINNNKNINNQQQFYYGISKFANNNACSSNNNKNLQQETQISLENCKSNAVTFNRELGYAGLNPNSSNEWIKDFMHNPLVSQLFPSQFQDFQSLFKLKNSAQPLKIKLKFPTKEQFLEKAELLHSKKRSKFHNKNKLFFISIIKIFKKKLTQQLFFSEKLFDKFFALVNACRMSGRKVVNNKVVKTDLFNHSHYNLLFLTLNNKSMNEISINEQDYKIHLKVFGIDIKQKKIVDPSKVKKITQMFQNIINSSSQDSEIKVKRNDDDETMSTKDINNWNSLNKDQSSLEQNSKVEKQEEECSLKKIGNELHYYTQENHQNVGFWEFVEFINFLKICVYQVVVIHLKDVMIGNSEQQCEEREYDYRAFKGILEMIQGKNKDRF